ncbi:MAG: sigma-70 family RNA polymerase sigma factor [Planctomycetes bacterium]|nr:sigma-70 family RNA polymerase sigma factor [Planctomycetota bacterium]MBU1519024.1 sigma-70 family RNA polymerase sigma factor [Planctomycetota bacterium]MBU2457537.1 sigma-70 family RNA polymerase sigma factor [Planctomycetota bacterium]MBU2597449.1 sigma-70 family RNA polymerase sigma factor [Planctomycetota bacterium]
MTVFDTTIKEYLTEIDASPLLSWQEECDLANRIIEDDDPQARDQLVRSNLRLVVSIAKRFATGKTSLGDLIEEGNLGLIRAVDSFDPSVGVRFSTYAAWWIKQTIKRALLLDSGPLSVPTYMVELVNQYKQVVADLQAKLADIPTVEQIAQEMKLPAKKINAIKEIADSINAPLQEESPDTHQTFHDAVKQTSNHLPEDEITNSEELKKIVEMLDKLESREAQILKLRFGIDGKEPLTLKQIGAKLGLTRERVRQLQQSALKQLNELMSYE